MEEVVLRKLSVLAVFGLALLAFAQIASADYQTQYGGIVAQEPQAGYGGEGDYGASAGEASGSNGGLAVPSAIGPQVFAKTGGMENSFVVGLGDYTLINPKLIGNEQVSPPMGPNESIQSAEDENETIFGDGGVLMHIERGSDHGEFAANATAEASANATESG